MRHVWGASLRCASYRIVDVTRASMSLRGSRLIRGAVVAIGAIHPAHGPGTRQRWWPAWPAGEIAYSRRGASERSARDVGIQCGHVAGELGGQALGDKALYEIRWVLVDVGHGPAECLG